MEKIVRFSTTIAPKLLDQFDEILEEKGYANRSEGIRDLIRNFIVASEWEHEGGEAIGSLTLLYDHDVRGVSDKLVELQHSHHANILSSMHVHLDEHNCLEVLVIKGEATEIQHISDALIAARGVKHGKLVMSSAGKGLG
ncbi:nickel-responsive transcriptional regulator NikR [archaeon]|nr:nickel-responsive transcriptional regulator NikR [archaeon]